MSSAFDSLLHTGVTEVIPEKQLLKELDHSKDNDKPLTIKLGADPTSPDLHLGHAVVFWKLREFQDAGHDIVFIIGDYTSLIGDPSEKDSARPTVNAEIIAKNSETYFDQVGKILDLEKIRIVKNSDWLSKMDFAEIIGMCRHFTVQQMLSRETFRKRIDTEQPLHVHEILYPVVQAIDSVHLEADVELGGTDQKFNVLAGRQLQEALGKKPQSVVLMPILTGLDGSQKMSKSLGNYVGLLDSPEDMFGKLMSIPDALILEYAELCARKTPDELQALRNQLEDAESGKDGAMNPRDIKAGIAQDIVTLYHSSEAADQAQAAFVQVFAKGALPDDIPEFVLDAGTYTVLQLLTESGLCSSNGEARRMVEQGGVKLDQEKVADSQSEVAISSDELVLQVGKRKFVRIHA